MSPPATRRPIAIVVVVVAYVAAAMLAATMAPLLAYTTSLACFGLAHVVVELRYVDARFGRRLPRTVWLLTGVPLLGVVALRGARLVTSFDSDWPVRAELVLVATMVLVGAVLVWRWRPPVGIVGAIAVGLIVIGVVVAPIETLLVLAIGHNVTPLGFVIERAPPGRRWLALLVGALVFLGAPLLVASGLPSTVLAGHIDLDTRFGSALELRQHLGVYLWPAWQRSDVAVQLFSAAVCAQLLHYGAVLVWLPRSLTDDDVATVPWGRPAVFVAVLGIIALGLAGHFAVDFAGARALYGLPAAVHAWLELPVLLVAFGLPGLSAKRGPAGAPGQS
jgi:hypothetical protein